MSDRSASEVCVPAGEEAAGSQPSGTLHRARLEAPPAVTPSEGFAVVLTADRSLFARYDVLLDGMVAAVQTTRIPSPLMSGVLARPLRRSATRAPVAPLGLRRIEAALAAAGRPPEQTAVVAPEDLSRSVGPGTRLIGISSGDPLGFGMTSTTMASVVGGKPWTAHMFQRLARRVARLRRRAPCAEVVFGGPGAWQLARDDAARKRLGIDHIIVGYCEANVARLFDRIEQDPSAPAVLEGRSPAPADIPPVLGPTLMGNVEISRGCALGCRFCTLRAEPMVHLPVETILADVQTNLRAGRTSVALITEDVLRFGASGLRPDANRLIALLERLRGLPGLRHIQTDHANICSVARLDDGALRTIHRLMCGDDRSGTLLWLNVGIETASGRLLREHGGAPKMGGVSDDEWPRFCLEQVRRLMRLRFFPLVSLVMGLPGETDEDAARTLAWVESLRHDRVAVFPVFYAPIGPREKPFGRHDMTALNWRLFRACYRLNFRWMPRLLWTNHLCAGVSWSRRGLMQVLGRGQTWWWRALLAWRSRRLFA